MRPIRSCVFAVVALAGAASVALAVPTPPPTDMNMFISQVGGPSWQWQNSQPGTWTQNAGNPNLWNLTGSASSSAFAVDFSLDLNPDPFISNTFALTNNTASVQTYNITVVLPVSPVVLAPSQASGSISGSVGDANFNGFAQMTSVGPGTAIYTALIDGSPYQQLLPDPFTVTTAPIPGNTTPFPTGTNFFLFPSGQPGVVTSIAINNQFTLTPGDSVTMVSTFFIETLIPTPGAAGLGAVGVLALARRRRR